MAQFLKKPKSTGYPHKEEAEASVYVAQSDSVIYSSVTAVTLFKMPANTLLIELAIKPTTAWESNDIDLTISDSAGNRLMYVGGLQSGLGQITQPIVQKLYREFTAEASVMLSMNGTPTAGSLEVWAMYRVLSNKQNPLATAA